MKERIRKVMENQQMTQQEFADFIHISPASLSSIFTGRTRPTLAIVEAIKNCLPNISTDWLLFGRGDMYINKVENSAGGADHAASVASESNGLAVPEPVIDFTESDLQSPAPQPSVSAVAFGAGSASEQYAGRSRSGNIRNEVNSTVKNIDILPRSITEIRIFYSDQTWETFVPKK